MMEIRQGRPEDYPQLMEQVVQSFRERNPAHPRFEPLYPDVIGPDEERMSHWRLAFVDGKLAAGIEIIPQRLRLGPDVILPSGGIGNVHCWHPYRKSGCMSALLQRCIADMTAMGDLISLLGGDRLRYGNYGWEYAGSQRTLSLSASMRRTADGLPPPLASCDLRTYNGNDADAALILRLYTQRSLGAERPTLEFCQAVLNRPNIVTYLDGDDAYLTIDRGNHIVEYAGDTDALERILRFLLKSGNWSVALPPVELSGKTEAMFLSYATGYQVTSAGMCRINDLAGTLNAFLPLLRQRLDGWMGSLTIGCHDGMAARLDADTTTLAITPTLAPADVTVSRAEMARLLFGPFPPPLNNASIAIRNTLRLLFPLPLFWTPLDHI